MRKCENDKRRDVFTAGEAYWLMGRAMKAERGPNCLLRSMSLRVDQPYALGIMIDSHLRAFAKEHGFLVQIIDERPGHECCARVTIANTRPPIGT